MEGIRSSYNILGALTYVRGIVMAAVGRAGLTSRNSYESVIVSMIFNAKLASSIDENLLSVSFINI